MQEARFAGACHNQHAGRPAPSLGSIVQQAETSDQGYGAGARVPKGLGPRAWGRGLRAGASRALAPGLRPQTARSEKVSGGKQAKGWETAETAAAEVGAWREAGTGYPPYPPPWPSPAFLGCGRKEEGFHPLRTETIQHAPQGRRT